MSITATVCDKELKPITEDYKIEGEDWTDVEAAARDLNSRNPVCIRWSRSEDGQVAYYSPSGVCFEPHWYKRPGRPKEIKDGKRREVYLTDDAWIKAKELGEGSASAGIRKLLDDAI